MTDWLLFAATAVVIVASGYVLALSADVLARHTGLGTLWFGAVVVGMVTSLSELATGIAAVRRGAPDLALGNLFGAGMLDMANLALVTLVFTTHRLLQRAALEHVLTASLAITLTALALVFLSGAPDWALGGIGVGPLVIAAAYVLGTLAIRERQAAATLGREKDIAPGLSPGRALAGFTLAAAVILISGPFLAQSADRLADRTGLGETFFGSTAVSFVTTLPELAVTVSAVRVGALNIAIGGLLGSCAMNMALILPMDLALPGESILAVANPGHVTAAAVLIALLATETVAIVLKAERGRLPVDLAAIVMLGLYGFGLVAVYESG